MRVLEGILAETQKKHHFSVCRCGTIGAEPPVVEWTFVACRCAKISESETMAAKMAHPELTISGRGVNMGSLS